MSDEPTLRQLHNNLLRTCGKSSGGSAALDAKLASTLGLSVLNYTSNDTDAQTLLPAGWSWTGVSSCVRMSDLASLNRSVFATLGAPQPSDALKRCITAMEARIVDHR